MTAKEFLDKKNIGEHCFQDNGVPDFMASEMEEYSKQESQKFGNFILHLDPTEKSHFKEVNNGDGSHTTTVTPKSVDELYEEFKNQK